MYEVQTNVSRPLTSPHEAIEKVAEGATNRSQLTKRNKKLDMTPSVSDQEE